MNSNSSITPCNICSKIDSYVVACDGGCNRHYHPSCVRRSASAKNETGFACKECSEIKPYHLMRFLYKLSNKMDQLTSVSDFMADKLKALDCKWHLIEELSDEQQACSKVMDTAICSIHDMQTSLDFVKEKLSLALNKVIAIETVLPELQSAAFEPLSNSGSTNNISISVMPVLDDIKRNIRHLKSDISSCTALMLSSTEKGSSNAACDAVCSVASQTSPLDDLAVLTNDSSVQEALIAPKTSKKRSQNKRNKQKRKQQKEKNSQACNPPIQPIASRVEGDENAIPASPLNDSIELIESMPQSTPPSTSPDTDCAVEPQHVSTDQNRPFFGKLRAARQGKSLFVSNLDPTTSEDDVIADLLDMLRYSGITDASPNLFSCKQISSSGRHYFPPKSSFRITMPENCFDVVCNTELWPQDVIVREFTYRPRSRLTWDHNLAPKNWKALGKLPTPT